MGEEEMQRGGAEQHLEPGDRGELGEAESPAHGVAPPAGRWRRGQAAQARARRRVPPRLREQPVPRERDQVRGRAQRLRERAHQPTPQRRRAARALPHRHAHERVVREPSDCACDTHTHMTHRVSYTHTHTPTRDARYVYSVYVTQDVDREVDDAGGEPGHERSGRAPAGGGRAPSVLLVSRQQVQVPSLSRHFLIIPIRLHFTLLPLLFSFESFILKY